MLKSLNMQLYYLDFSLFVLLHYFMIFHLVFQVIKDILDLVYDIKPQLHVNYRVK